MFSGGTPPPFATCWLGINIQKNLFKTNISEYSYLRIYYRNAKFVLGNTRASLNLSAVPSRWAFYLNR
jgi:hypothetical protein